MKTAAGRSLKTGDENIKWLRIHRTEISKWLTDNVLVTAPSSAADHFINVLTVLVSASTIILRVHFLNIR